MDSAQGNEANQPFENSPGEEKYDEYASASFKKKKKRMKSTALKRSTSEGSGHGSGKNILEQALETMNDSNSTKAALASRSKSEALAVDSTPPLESKNLMFGGAFLAMKQAASEKKMTEEHQVRSSSAPGLNGEDRGPLFQPPAPHINTSPPLLHSQQEKSDVDVVAPAATLVDMNSSTDAEKEEKRAQDMKEYEEYWSSARLQIARNPTIISLSAFKGTQVQDDVEPIHVVLPPLAHSQMMHPCKQLYIGEPVKPACQRRQNVPPSRLEQMGIDVDDAEAGTQPSEIVVAGFEATGPEEADGIFRLKGKFTMVSMLNITVSTVFFALQENPTSAGALTFPEYNLLMEGENKNLYIYMAIAILNTFGIIAAWSMKQWMITAYRSLLVANFVFSAPHIPYFFFVSRYALDAWGYVLAGMISDRMGIVWFDFQREE